MSSKASQKWNKVRLEDVATIVDCPHSTPKWTEEGIFSVRNFNLSNGRIVKDKVSYVDEETYTERTRRATPKIGDIIFSREAPIGSVGYVNTSEKMCLGQRVVLIQPKPNIDGRFLLYQLLSKDVQNQFKQSEGTGSTVSNVRIPVIKDTKISYTELNEQRAISSVIVVYDDLIENNNRRIKILEGIAQKIYSEWFINRPKNDREENWKEESIGKYIEVLKGKNITKKTIRNGDVPVVAGGMEPAYYHDTPNAVGPVITISASGANSGFAKLYFEDIWASDCSYINNEVTKHVFFFYSLLKAKQKELTHLQRGSAQPHVYPKEIMSIKARFPQNKKVIDGFEAHVTPLFTLIGNLKKQTAALSKMRDLLIPHLVTGKLEVKI